MGSAPKRQQIATIAKKRSFGSRPRSGHSLRKKNRVMLGIQAALTELALVEGAPRICMCRNGQSL